MARKLRSRRASGKTTAPTSVSYSALPGRTRTTRTMSMVGDPYRVTLSARSLADAMERTFRAKGTRELLKVKGAFQLSSAELGELFGGVTRQAIDKWMDHGVPADRVAEVDRIAEVATKLGVLFKKQRLPQIVRGSMNALDGRSILDVLKTEGVEPIHAFFRMMVELVPGAAPIRAGDFSKRKATHAAAR